MSDARMREMYGQHADALRRFLTGLGQSPNDAADIVQETMLRAWRNINTIDPDRARSWLFTVARRIMFDQHRARLTRPATVSLSAFGGGGRSGVTDGGVERVIDRETVVEALAAMAPAQRRVFVLRYVYGLTVSETAAELGIPLGTAKSKEHYGRRAAMRALAVTR